METIQRFMNKVDISSDSDCVFWIGSKDYGGYGRFNVAGVNSFAHRYIYEISEGPIPEGMFIDHICRNRSCVNTLHLRVVTPRQNSLENSVSIPAIRHKQVECVNGHKFDAANTYRTKNGLRQCRKCGPARKKEKRRLSCTDQTTQIVKGGGN